MLRALIGYLSEAFIYLRTGNEYRQVRTKEPSDLHALHGFDRGDLIVNFKA